MSTERELLGKMKAFLRQAAECCDKLAVYNVRGRVYDQLRDKLKQIEIAAQQLAYHREDARWLQVGLRFAEARKIAGDCLRATTNAGIRHPFFVKLAEYLRSLITVCADLETKATGRRGMILPKPKPGPHRDTRPVQVMTPGGIILPPGYARADA